MKPGIPPNSTRVGPGMYADRDGGFHVDLEQLIIETGGDPRNPTHRQAAERAAAHAAHELGIPVETREYDD